MLKTVLEKIFSRISFRSKYLGWSLNRGLKFNNSIHEITPTSQNFAAFMNVSILLDIESKVDIEVLSRC